MNDRVVHWSRCCCCLLIMCAPAHVHGNLLTYLNGWHHWLADKMFQRPHVPECKAGFGMRGYRDMRNDLPRTRAYVDAITAHAPGRVVLDLGTGALALLAIAAARAGATQDAHTCNRSQE